MRVDVFRYNRHNVPVKMKLRHLSPGQTPGLVQIFSPRGKKAVQMPQQLVLKYLFSKTNFAFNQTLFKLFRVRYAVNDTFKLLLKTVMTELFTNLTNKGEILSWISVKPRKNRKNARAHNTRTRDKSGSNSPPRARTTVKCPGYARGDVEASI